MYRTIGFCFLGLFLVLNASAAIWYVDDGGSGSGTSWGDASPDLQATVDAAFADGGGEVWVAEGTYVSTSDPVLTLRENVVLYGGFVGTELQREQRDWATHLSVVDGQDSRRCVIGSENATLDGFKIQEGNILGHGGGMYNDSVSPTVANCTFYSNTNSGTGLAGGRGGAVYNANSTATFVNCRFIENWANGGGGGIYNYNGSPTIMNCWFEGNDTADYYSGGGAYNSESAASYHNCVFFNNIAYTGGGLGGYHSAATVTNCTFAKNTAEAGSDAGGGIYNNGNAGMTITNTILHYNSPDNIFDSGTAPTVTYTMIQWNNPYPGPGNTFSPPRFVDMNAGDLRLRSTSQLIDAGNNAAVITSTDLDGGPRILDTVDFGAYEFFILGISDKTPAANALNVATDTPVTATLNADLGSVTGASKVFKLSSQIRCLQNGVETSLSYDNSDPFVLTQTVAQNFWSGERVFASLYKDDFELKPHTWEFRAAVSPVSPADFTQLEQVLGNANSTAVALGDLDGDGDLDAFVTNSGQADRIWLNGGAGNFTDSGQTLSSGPSSDVALGDVDGDGDLDALVGDTSGGNSLWLNNGSGVFGYGQGVDYNAGYAVALMDVDGDGDLDAFIATDGPNRLWENDGNGSFSDTGQEVGQYRDSRGMDYGDLDGDGLLDVILTNLYTDDEVSLNDGNGSFNGISQPGSSSMSYDVALGDLDGDGDLDAFLAQGAADKIWVNDGAGNFSDSGQSLGTTPSTGVALGDLDGDGDLDAVITKAGGAGNEAWLNDGSGVFANSLQSLGASEGTRVALGDLDGDACLDAFIVNSSGQSNTVWRNGDLPAISTQAASAVTLDAATLNGVITIEGPQPVTGRGFYWAATPFDSSDLSAATEIAITPDPGGAGTFNATLTGLNEGSDYYYLVYAINSLGTTFSPVESFTTKSTPVITWGTPAPIVYGTALDATQLNASANTSGTFTYTPDSGAVLSVGEHLLNVEFVPDDAELYVEATATVTITVNGMPTTVTEWPTASAIVYGQSLADSLLTGGSATPSSGVFAFETPATIPDAGLYSAAVTYTPTDTDYSVASGVVEVNVQQASAVVTITNVEQEYDGTPKEVTVTTEPAGLSVSVAYNGGATLPMEVGEYAVFVNVANPNYTGSATATLSIFETYEETREITAAIGEALCLTAPDTGTAADGDFFWSFATAEGETATIIPDESNAEFCIDAFQETDAGVYVVTYFSSATQLNRITFSVEAEQDAPLTSAIGLALIAMLVAASAVWHFRRKRA